MKLPNTEHAVVAPEKIIAYLLNPANRQNQGKAAFFSAFGFTVASWNVLAVALRAQAVRDDVDGMREDAFGVRILLLGRSKRWMAEIQTFAVSGRLIRERRHHGLSVRIRPEGSIA